VDVSSRLQGQVCASLVESGCSLPDSLVLEPLQEEYYYEVSCSPFHFKIGKKWFASIWESGYHRFQCSSFLTGYAVFAGAASSHGLELLGEIHNQHVEQPLH
jgi:hypothetical protein